MGVKIVGGAFAASVKSVIQHGRASTKYWPGVSESESLIGYSDRGSINPRTEWPGGSLDRGVTETYDTDLAAACRRDTNLALEREDGNNHDKVAVSFLKHATVVGHVPREFSRVFWHFLRHGGTTTTEVTNQRKRGKAILPSASSAILRFLEMRLVCGIIGPQKA